MAKGQVFSIANNTAVLRNTQSNTEKQSLAILNPNDGVLYIAIDRAADNSLSGWDWKLPSQSYGVFPGPWQSVGLYYLDQSGAGVAGEFNLYDLDTQLYIPDIRSVGRALQARQNTLDITQGNQPPNPPVGVERLWANSVDSLLHVLLSNGNDYIEVNGLSLPLSMFAGVGIKPLVNVTGGVQSSGISAAVNSSADLSGSYSFTLDQPTKSACLVYCLYAGYAAGAGGNTVLVNMFIDIDGSNSGYMGSFDTQVVNGQDYRAHSIMRYYAPGVMGAGTHAVKVRGFFQTTSTSVYNIGGNAGHQFVMLVLELKI